MKNLQFAMFGMVILLAAAASACVLYSCSFAEKIPDEADEIENVLPGSNKEDESGAVEEPPVTEKNPPGKNPPADEEPSPPEKEDDDQSYDPSLPDEENPDGEAEFNLPEEDTPDPHEPSSDGLSVLINELRTEYSGSTSRVEFIELKILSSGNLDGLRVFIAGNTQNPLVYQFLPVEVKKSDYVLLHLRTLEETCVDEYTDNLNESGGTDSSPSARDFWIPGNTELLRKTDAVYIVDKDDIILDAVIFAEDVIPARSIAFFNQAYEFLINNGAWKPVNEDESFADNAVKSSNLGTAMTRSLSRDKTTPDTNTAADWYVTATGGYTPGKKNDPRRF